MRSLGTLPRRAGGRVAIVEKDRAQLGVVLETPVALRLHLFSYPLYPSPDATLLKIKTPSPGATLELRKPLFSAP